MEIGIKNTLTVDVIDSNTALAMGSGTLKVFATPAMIALIEETAWKSVADSLEEGMATVGISLNVNHLAPTPLGMNVRCETELVEIDGRKLKFKAEVYDEKGLIGNGIHERFIINSEKFQQKADSKKE
ncbi:MAG: thioesterase family protein [Prevotellaceae bacterium]|nr:thioesterase family protein [Prevotellaceae bacterium]